MKPNESKDMNNTVVVLTSDDNTVTVLGGELDNEDYWEETGDSQFRHKFNKDVELVTSCDNDDIQFNYIIGHNENYKVQFVNAETNEELTQNLSMHELVQSMCNNDNIKICSKQITDNKVTLECIILNRKIKINMYRLLSLYKPKYTLSITMTTCK